MKATKKIAKSVDNETQARKVMFGVLGVILATFVIVLIFLSRNWSSAKVVLPDNFSKAKIVTIEIDVKDVGKARFDLRNDLVPKTVKAFTTKILEGYYTNRLFYRADKFMVCAGSVNNKEGIDVSSGLKLDTSDQLRMEKYSIAMAKNKDNPNSSDKIFFISRVKEESQSQYSIFGKIKDVESESVIDKIKIEDSINKITILAIDDQPYISNAKNINYVP